MTWGGAFIFHGNALDRINEWFCISFITWERVIVKEGKRK